MLSTCVATEPSSTSRPTSVRTTWMLRRSLKEFSRTTRPAPTIRSIRRVTPPLVRPTSSLSRLMVCRPLGAAATWMRTSKKTGGMPTACLSSRFEVVGEVAVGTHNQAHQTDAVVMHLSERARVPSRCAPIGSVLHRCSHNTSWPAGETGARRGRRGRRHPVTTPPFVPTGAPVRPCVSRLSQSCMSTG